jgi:hypothetical protein
VKPLDVETVASAEAGDDGRHLARPAARGPLRAAIPVERKLEWVRHLRGGRP